jgi:hypothetical protein
MGLDTPSSRNSARANPQRFEEFDVAVTWTLNVEADTVDPFLGESTSGLIVAEADIGKARTSPMTSPSSDPAASFRTIYALFLSYDQGFFQV